MRYRSKVVGLDLDRRVALLADGARISYKACVSTMPLDYTLRLIGENNLAGKLFYSSSHVIGVGCCDKRDQHGVVNSLHLFSHPCLILSGWLAWQDPTRPQMLALLP
jgi:hypothetical protein